LPAANAAAICPLKMAKGKFHGLMLQKTPPPWSFACAALLAGTCKWKGLSNSARAQDVIPTEVNGLAHLRNRIVQRLARLAHAQRHDLGCLRLHQVGGAIQAGGAILDGQARPLGRSARRRGQRVLYVVCRCLGNPPDDLPVVCRRDDVAGISRGLLPSDDRGGRPNPVGGLVHSPRQRCQTRPVAEIDTLRVAPLRAVEVDWLWDVWVRHIGERAHGGHGVGDDLLYRKLVILDAVDKGGVGPVLQEPADQISEQVFMLTDRSIDPAAYADLVLLDHLLVQELAHAVQTLELKVATVAGKFQH
jgi:hypothetical protein